jgi:tetratricopeptide (TPR) repeat protein
MYINITVLISPFKKTRHILCLFFISIIPFIKPAICQDIENINLANEYYQKGDLDKSEELYDRLAKNDINIPAIHNNYFDLLVSKGDYDKATKYIDRRIKSEQDNKTYLVDKGIILKRKGDKIQEDEYFKKLIKNMSADEIQTRIVAQYLIKKQMFEYAKQMYLSGRAALNNPQLYSLELANVYRVLNERDLMISEYLDFVNQNPNNINYIKSVLQSSLVDKSDLEKIELILIDRIQKDPESKTYSDLLIWVNIQERNFYGAFIQARAFDRRFEKDGNKVLEVGFLALDNKAYSDAVQIFEYLCNNYQNSYIYPIAKRYKIQSREELVKNTYPVNLNEIRKLANDYKNLTIELGLGPQVAEALLNKAHLHAFYLDEIDSAIIILNQILNIPKINPDLAARCKLDLGDIYILSGQPWESVLLYAQVEKGRKDSPIGYEAKLRSAKLSYYTGDFSLAQEHLDVLKLATSREIANDAMQLSIFIKDNSALDTSDFLLQKYANIELMLFQNKKQSALDSLFSLYKKYPGSSLSDDVLWKAANIEVEMGKFEKAIEDLQIITSNYGTDILGDDAMYRIGEIYQNYLKDPEKAKEVFRELLSKYPGSIYTSEARKRFRLLRGDVVSQ